MFSYIIRRLLIMIPTIFGITLVVFAIINLAPGSPVERKLQEMRFGGMGQTQMGMDGPGKDSSGISDEVLEALKKQYGFDKPVHIRYLIWLKNIFKFDFGESFTYEEPVTDVIISKFPVSLQFGVISLFLSYLICIPLGVMKAVKNGAPFDIASSFALFVMYSIPGFMLGILLIVFFAGGSFYEWFPVGELYSDMYDDFSTWEKITDRVEHFILPLICYMIGSFTVLTMLMKNSLLDEVGKDYVRTARAKGLSERMVYLKHALRNSLIPIVTGLGGFLSVFFAGSMLLEMIFNLDGIGLMSYQAVLERDYNLIMGSLFIQAVIMLVGNLISDLAYVVVDPRIDFK
ncbi:MAG: peptide ABC transporter permease [Epsilonproteobacteria bacterium]|nr:MAG: peptide ABC transporter permease [Campylobacterota bacterium]RLA66173.1 MAG: peptide ABC transporter permease [Campylobacterota bacterium]